VTPFPYDRPDRGRLLAKVLEPNIRLERRDKIVALKTINFPHSGYQRAEGISRDRKNKRDRDVFFPLLDRLFV
jgi:hypothetical protein